MVEYQQEKMMNGKQAIKKVLNAAYVEASLGGEVQICSTIPFDEDGVVAAGLQEVGDTEYFDLRPEYFEGTIKRGGLFETVLMFDHPEHGMVEVVLLKRV